MPWLETDPMNERKPSSRPPRASSPTPNSADATISAARLATSGSSDTRPRDPTGCSNAPIGPIAVPTPLSPTSSRLPSSSAVIDPGGEQPRFSAGSSRCTPRSLPAPQVLHRHFLREGLVNKLRRRRKPSHPGRPTAPFDAPNSIWSADFKGQFKTLDGVYCYPLTVQDGFSRYLLACQGLAGTTYAGSRLVFTRLSSASPTASAPITVRPSPPLP